MIDTQPWAVRRQLTILGVLFVILTLLGTLVYFQVVYQTPTCFDGIKNGDEAGVDCDGSCERICAFSVIPPTVQWIEAFKIVDGQYNVVAYIENKNRVAGAPELTYTITLADAQGEITTRTNTIALLPDTITPIFEGRVTTNGRIPTDVTITFSDSGVWRPVANVREQFTLVDRGRIENADATPRLRATIRNNNLSSARDVAVVSTIYNYLGEPLTASQTFIDFPAEGLAEATFTWPEPIATTLRSCEIPSDTILAVDLSGSMNNLGIVPPQPLTAVKLAAQAFAERIGESDQVGVVTFATNGDLVAPLQADTQRVSTLINSLTINPAEETGSTNSGAALTLAAEEFATVRHSLDARKVIILLTDGLTNAPGDNPEAYALAQAQTLKDAGVTIFTIGLGDQVERDFLAAMASGPENFFSNVTADTVDEVYRSITEDICEERAARVDIIPIPNITF